MFHAAVLRHDQTHRDRRDARAGGLGIDPVHDIVAGRIILDTLRDRTTRGLATVIETVERARKLRQRIRIARRQIEGHDMAADADRDHRAIKADAAEIDAPILRHEEGYPHRLEFRVHVRIMDDLAGQVDGTIRELLSGLVGVLDRALDSITKAELLRQTDGYVPHRQGIIPILEEVYQVARIVGIQFGLYLGFQAETFPKVRRFPGSVRGAGLHISCGGDGGPARTLPLHRRVRHTLNLAVTNR